MKNKNFLKKLTAGILGFVMTLGVGAAGYAGAANEAKAASTYTMTIDSSASGSNNVHWTATSVTSLTYDDITWSTSVTGTTSVTSSKTYAQIGSKNSPATKVELSTKGFGGKKITGVAVTCYCMSNSGPTLTVTAGSTTFINASALTKGTNTRMPSTSGVSATLGSSDEVTITFNSSAKAAIAISKVEVEWETGVIHTVSISSGPDSIYKGNIGEYTATCSPTSDSVSSWTIINANPSGCATINSSGKVTAKAQGTATVKVTSSGGVSAEKNITINDNNLVLSDKPIIGESGGTSQLLPKFDNWNPSTTPTYSYSSDNTNIATVSTGGLITFGSTTGTTKVHCTTTVNTVNFSGEVSVTTTTSDPTAQLSKDKSTPYYTGDTYTVTAAFSNIQQADTIIRIIHNGVNTDKTNVSSVTGTFSEAGDYDFVVLNKNDGNKQISETLTISVTASSITDIEIYDADTGEEVTELNFTLPTDASKTVELAARVTGVGHYSSTVTWSSSAPTKVSVGSSSGVVQPLGKVSNATITAIAEGGKTATITVNVDKMGETESVTFADCGYENGSEAPTYNFNNSKIEYDKGENSNAPKYYTSGASIRAYGSNKITISSNTLNIVKIELIYGSGDGSNDILTDCGNFSEDSELTVGTWTGKSKSVCFTIDGSTGHRRIASINVTYEAAADITSITLTGSYKTAYTTNEKFDATGLGVSIGYDEGDPGADTYAANPSKFAFYKSNSFIDANKLTSGTSSINSVSKVYVVYNGNTELAQSYDVTVTSHTVTVSSAGDATSVLAKATLQMSATHDAGGLEDDAITWSVKAANGTSSTTAASISDSGLLTGGTVTSATTVTVIATCKYGGSDSKQITINPHTITLSGSATAVINRAYSFTCVHDGFDTVSYKVITPAGTELSPAITETSFTPTSIGTYKITASCSCCSESNELDVEVDYTVINSVRIKYNNEFKTSISCLAKQTISGFSAVAYDENSESSTVKQLFDWSIDYDSALTTIDPEKVTFDSSVPSIYSTGAGDLVLKATARDTSVSATILISIASVSASITYSGSPLDVYYGSDPNTLEAVATNFENPRYHWSVEEGSHIEVIGSETSKYGMLVYNGVTSAEGETVTLTINEAEDETVVATATVNVVVRSSGLDYFKIKNNGTDVTGSTVELWDNGQFTTFTYDISGHGVYSDTAAWSLSGATSLVSSKESNGGITITTANKISEGGTVTLTATNNSTYADPSVSTASVTILVKKSSVTVNLPENQTEIYNGLTGSVAVTVSSTGNITDAQKTVTYSKSTANSSEINSAFNIEQNGLSCSISVSEAYPIASSKGFYITVTNDYDGTTQDMYIKVLESKITDFNIDGDAKSKTIYATSISEKNSVKLSASMSCSGCASNKVDWSIPDGETAISLSKTQSDSGEQITVYANKDYDFGTTKSHTVTLTAKSHFDPSAYDTISIIVNREYVTKLEWTGGSNIDDFEGLTLSTGWGFKATYNSTKSENPTLGDGDNNVHVYIVDDAEITDEPTDLTPVSSTQKLSASDNGKHLVAFYKGFKCATTFDLTATERLHDITVTETSTIIEKDKVASGDWDLTSVSDEWTASGNTTYFGKPYGFKAKDGTLTSHSVSDFALDGIKSITIGFKCLQNGGTTSKLTLYLYDDEGNVLCSEEVVPPNASVEKDMEYRYATFTTNLEGADHFGMKVTTFGKNILINAASYEVTYDKTTTTTTKTTYTNSDLTAQKAVVDFAKWFNANADSKTWLEIQNEYASKVTNILSGNSLTYAQKMFKHAVHSGSDLDVLQQCVEKYDQLVYLNNYENFLDRTVSAVFSVTVDKADGSTPVVTKVDAGKTFTLPEKPTYGSYDFQYWDVDGTPKNPGDVITVSNNVIVTAVWSEQLTMSTDIAFQFTGLTMTKGEIKYSVDFDETKDGIKEYGFLVTTNTELDPTQLTAGEVYGNSVSGYSKVIGKEKAAVASKNLELNIKVVFYYIDDTGYHYSEVITTSFKEIALTYDANNYKDEYARACFLVYQASIKDSAE